jgi:hypothetical protein
MSVAEDTTQIPIPIPEVVTDNAAAAIVNAVVNDLQSTISNTLEAPLNLVSETPKLVESATETILKESQAVIDETTKLIDNITSVMAGKSDAIVEETTKVVDETTKAIMSEGQAIVDETTKLVVKTAENIANIVSEEEKRLTETISRLSIEMEQETKKDTGLFARIHKFVKLITSCTHRADKSVVKVSTSDVHVNVANVV